MTRALKANADPTQFPPMFVAVGGDEMFHDPIVRFVEGVSEAGVRTVLFDEPAMFHVYMILMPWLAASQRIYADLRERFDAAYEGRAPRVDTTLLDPADRGEQRQDHRGDSGGRDVW